MAYRVSCLIVPSRFNLFVFIRLFPPDPLHPRSKIHSRDSKQNVTKTTKASLSRSLCLMFA
jgi:hypothetical protein